MRAIFISYRRNDSEGEAGRLFDDLVGHFGEDSVFMDVSAIEAGRDFRKAIDESVATCGVLLAIIGNNWVAAKNDAGLRRLDDPADFVRLETAAALRRDIPVIPVLIRGAKMPRPEQLPDDLKDLAYRNGVELTHARWGSDIRLLIKALDTVLRPLRRAGTTETPQSGGQAADGASLVDRPSEKSASAKPSSGPLAVRRRETKWLALGGGLMVVLALVGYGAYYFKVEQERQAMEQQRRTSSASLTSLV
jgi:TIR domain